MPDLSVFEDRNPDGSWQPFAALAHARDGDLTPLAEVLREAAALAPKADLSECLRFAADQLDGRKLRRPPGRPRKTIWDGHKRFYSGNINPKQLAAFLAAGFVREWSPDGSRRKIVRPDGRKEWIREAAARKAIEHIRAHGADFKFKLDATNVRAVIKLMDRPRSRRQW